MKKQQPEETLSLKYVPLSTVKQWGDNVKRHDLDTIIKSIQTHGFKDPLKFEPALNNGAGGIVEGNGRDQALKSMFAQNPKKPPRGILIGEGGIWAVPVLFGVDAKSQAMAESYGFDHNQITMMGGDLDLGQMMQAYTDQAATMLQRLQGSGALPVSISAEGLDSLLEAEREQLNERNEEIRPKTMLRVLISVPVDLALDAKEYIDALREIPGVEVDVSGND
jgi:hypothetical protein